MRVSLQLPPSLLRIKTVVFCACSMAVCSAYPMTNPRTGNMMTGIMMMPMRILGSRMSSLSSFIRMFLKPLSITNHLCKNFFQILALVFSFEFTGFSFNDDFALIHECDAVA